MVEHPHLDECSLFRVRSPKPDWHYARQMGVYTSFKFGKLNADLVSKTYAYKKTACGECLNMIL